MAARINELNILLVCTSTIYESTSGLQKAGHMPRSKPFPKPEMHYPLLIDCVIHQFIMHIPRSIIHNPRSMFAFPIIHNSHPLVLNKTTFHSKIIPAPERTATSVNPTANTFPAHKLAPNVFPLASLFLLVEEAVPVDEPETGLLAVA